MTRTTSLITVVLALLAALAVPAMGAPPGASELSWREIPNAPPTSDREWFTGTQPVQHVRGWATQADIVTEDPMIAGTVDVVVNWNLHLTAWRGNLWGTADYASSTHEDSGWHTTWTGQWTEPGSWAGIGRGQGYGAFEGLQLRFEVENVPGTPGVVDASGLVFTPGRP